MNICYWTRYPDDYKFVSPYYEIRENPAQARYLTFQWDVGGFNNIRLSIESMAALSLAMGRTLVLPPRSKLYLLKEGDNHGVLDFYDAEEMKKRFDMIHMSDFLEIAGTGVFGETPPADIREEETERVYAYLNQIGFMPHWTPPETVFVVPRRPKVDGYHALDSMNNDEIVHYISRENRQLISYDQNMDNQLVMWLPVITPYSNNGKETDNERFLINFYSFVVSTYEPYDSFFKRTIRDGLYYNEHIMGQASRIVRFLRERSRKHEGYVAMHVRRGDFQFTDTRIDSKQLYQSVSELLNEDTVLYIATDEKNRSFFQQFTANYETYFLSDFEWVTDEISSDYYGMMEQLICANAAIFSGTYWSTFTSYITRLRGYYGYDISTTYYTLDRFKYVLHQPSLPKKPYWYREFTAGWEGIETKFTKDDLAYFDSLREKIPKQHGSSSISTARAS